jgi:hypothetical protein
VVTKCKSIAGNSEAGIDFNVDGVEIYVALEALTESLNDPLACAFFDAVCPGNE